MTDHQHYSIENFGHPDDKWLAKRMPPEYHDIYLDERQKNGNNSNRNRKS
jgi:hypothetical protein